MTVRGKGHPRLELRIPVGAIVLALVFMTGGCSRIEKPHHMPVQISSEGVRLKVYFAPDNVRVFLFDAKGLPLDIESAKGVIIFREVRDVLSTYALDNVESVIEVPRDMMQAYMESMPWLESGDWASANDSKYMWLRRRFFWVGLGRDSAISSATRAEIIISRLRDHDHPIHVESHIRFAYTEGFACPEHTAYISDEPGTCPRDGIQREPVPSIFRCPMHESVCSLDEHELCWVCGRSLEKALLHIE